MHYNKNFKVVLENIRKEMFYTLYIKLNSGSSYLGVVFHWYFSEIERMHMCNMLCRFDFCSGEEIDAFPICKHQLV